MNTISRPIRLIPQTAQPIEFSCPICATVHAAYYFSSSRFKVYRCGGCGLTFANPIASSVSDGAVSSKPQRAEDQHRTLMSLLGEGPRSGEVLLFADRDDSILPLLQRMNITAEVARDDNDLRAMASRSLRFDMVVVSDAIMRVPDPCRILKTLRSLMAQGRLWSST